MAKSADSKTNRLTDMIVKEVSLVDRAANKREFLITKRDGSSMATKLVSDGRGGFTTVEVVKSEAAPVVPPAVAPVAPAVVATAEETEVEKAETVGMMGALAERILGVAKAYRDKGEIVPEGFFTEVDGMVGVIRKRRMGKARMDKFETGLASLQDLLTELKGETETNKSAPSAPAVAPPAAAAAPAASAPATAPAADMTKKYEDRLAASEAEIKKLREMPARSNSSLPEGELGAPGGAFSWPDDMAATARTETNKKLGLTF